LNQGKSVLAVSGMVLAILGTDTKTTRAHGIVGDRFFPPTIQTDDPFAVDELAFPTVSTFKNPGSPPTRETDVGFDFSKEIFPRLALGVSEEFVNLAPDGMSSVNGFNNFTLSAKYQLWLNAPHEAIFSAGAEWEVGGTGSRKIGATSANTFTPTVYYGKGFGDLPDALNYARPFALTGTLGQTFPTSAEPNNLLWGFALEYSLPYLQSQVKDLGLSAPFRNLIPLVEFSLSTPENRDGGPTTGTINPGILWGNKHLQIGVEAIIPANRATGSGVGAVFQVQFFIDDLLPKWFGHPIFGDKQTE
jgi:hypothetical protein